MWDLEDLSGGGQVASGTSHMMTQAGVPGIGVKLALCELEHLLETIQAGVPGM